MSLANIGGILIALLMIAYGAIKINPIVLIIGLGLLTFYFWMFMTWEREIIFDDENIKIVTPIRTVNIPYSQIKHIKFKWMGRFIADGVVLTLTNRSLFRRAFAFETANEKENIKEILNHCRAKGIPTGLNDIGDRYFQFDKNTGHYEVVVEK
jgi:hypothetical protein